MFLNWQTSIITTALDTGTTLFLYDPATNRDLVTGTVCGAIRSGTTVDGTILIDGSPTLKSTTGTHGVDITFPTPLDLNSLSEWTIEWSSKPVTIRAEYSSELFLNWPSGPLFGCRWTDSGYGHRLQFTDGAWTNPTLWRPESFTKTNATTKINRYAMVFKDGKISVYIDGVKQMLENGSDIAGPNTKQNFFPKATTWQPLTRLLLGYYSATYPSFLGNYGRVRISAGARYLANYTPAAF